MDPDVAFDAVFDAPKVVKALKLDRTAGPADAVAYVLTRKLRDDPGAKEGYANVGYVALGLALAAAENKPTDYAARRELVLKPAGIEEVRRRPGWPAPAGENRVGNVGRESPPVAADGLYGGAGLTARPCRS